MRYHLLLVTGILAATAPSFAAETVLQCGQLFDSNSGKVLGPHTLTIRDGRISEIQNGLSQARADAQNIDLSSKTCLPGLIDTHTHLTGETSPSGFTDQFRLNVADYAIRATLYAARTLQAGFTTTRDLGDSGNISIALRNAINAGSIPGPRIFSAGSAIGTTGGHADDTDGLRLDLQGDPGAKESIINGVDDAWKAVRQHYKDGVDVLKIMPSGGVLDQSGSADNPQMTLDEIKAIVAAAKDYGFIVAAHAHGAEGIRRAVIGGVDSIEHGTFMDAADMKLMKEHGTWYVPTIIAGRFVAEKAEVPGYYSPQVAAKAKKVGPIIQGTAGRAYKAGVKMAFGTDAAVYPHGENAKEFVYLTEAGIPAAYALQMSTLNAATLLKKTADLGSLEAGKFADVIAVPGNPLDDISVMQHVEFVMKAGKVYRQNNQATTP